MLLGEAEEGAGGRQRPLPPPPFQAGRPSGHRQAGEVGQVAEEARPGVQQAALACPAVLRSPATTRQSRSYNVRVKLPEIGR